MIPREILKKIRQIEVRGYRIVTSSPRRGHLRIPTGFRPTAQGCEERATLGHRRPNVSNRNAIVPVFVSTVPRNLCLLESLPKGVRIAAWVINGEHAYFVAFDRKINSVSKARHACPAHRTGFPEEKFRILANTLKESLDFRFKFATQSGLLLFVPRKSLQVVSSSERCEPQSPHFHPKRLRASSRTCSQGIPASGFLRNSSARRSSSAICSGVSSSSNRSRSCSKTSRCSSSGSLSICSKTWAALMPSIYPACLATQAGFCPSRITYHASAQP